MRLWLLVLALVPSLWIAACTASDDDDSALPDGTPTWTTDIQPMLESYCAPCHTGSALGSGGIAWLDAHENVTRPAGNLAACPGGITRAECLPRRIQARQMPEGSGCAPGEPGCPTQAEFDLLQQWVDAGAPE